MNANDLKTLIEIWKYDHSDNSGGTPIEEFKIYRKVYARMNVRSGSTTVDALGLLPFTSVEWTMRYDPVIDYRVQIKYNNAFYKINHIEIIGRNEWLKIITTVYNELV